MTHFRRIVTRTRDWVSKDGRLHGVIEEDGREEKLMLFLESQLILARDNIKILRAQ